MDRLRDLWAQVRNLYDLADKTEDKDQRFEIFLKAMALESEANALELASLQSQPDAPPHVAQQQQQPQPGDKK